MKGAKLNFVTDHSKSNVQPNNAPSLLVDRCLVCKGSHLLTQCGQFKAMRPYQRSQLARINRLCFSCLSRSHMMTTCDKSRTCNVDGCNKRHSIWLHLNEVRSSIQSNVYDSDDTHSLNAVTGNVNACMTGNRVCLPLVSVLVNGHEPAVALLYSESTNTLVTE